jgi:putative membrane protein
MKTRFFSLLIVGGAISFAACQSSGDGTPGDGDTSAIERAPDNTRVDENKTGMDSVSGRMTTLDDDSRKFVLEAASGGLMEVQLGQQAQQKAVNQRVKEFGAMMVRDHGKANEELKSTVNGKLAVPETMTDNHQHHVTDLSSKSGADFDKAYIKMMVDDHEADIRKFENIAKESNDPALRNFATNTLPTLRTHLDSAKAIRKDLK